MTDLTELEIDGTYSRRNTITINRDNLPKVRERDGKFWAGSGPEECVARGTENPNWLRRHANSALALAEFLEAREKNATEMAAAKLTARRNEVIAKFLHPSPPVWGAVLPIVQRMVDHIIELEDKTRG